MQDKLLQIFFEKSRWEAAIAKGVAKDISHGRLRYLCSKKGRKKILDDIVSGNYRISPPHTAYIPKDDGTLREVSVNEDIDRIVLSIFNDMLFDLCPEMVHPTCKSYQRGIGCGKVVQEASRYIVTESERIGGDNPIVGWKADFTKYFDRVPIQYIDAAFDRVEAKHGKSALMDVIRDYYHQDVYFDTRDGDVKFQYKSLKQGCAVASWLADVIMYELDAKLSSMKGMYIRYCDDTLFIGPDYKEAMAFMEQLMLDMSTPELNMEIQDHKREYIDRNHWVKFLGFSVMGDKISLSCSRIKTFQQEIAARSTDHRDPKTNKVSLPTADQAISAINRFLYIGDGRHSWASQVLPIINVEEDITELNGYVMDSIRAVMTRRTKIGGLGFVKEARKGRGCISRGRGRNVRSNRERTPQRIEGYRSLRCMANALRTDIGVYRAFVAGLK